MQRGQSREFLRETFDVRCKQLYPRDIILAQAPTRKGGVRTVGALRRSLRWCKEEARRIVHIDFVYVLRSHRGQGVGRKLLECAMLHGSKIKPVALVVAGSEANVSAVGLYESLGFCWVEGQRAHMVAPEAAVVRLAVSRGSLTYVALNADAIAVADETRDGVATPDAALARLELAREDDGRAASAAAPAPCPACSERA